MAVLLTTGVSQRQTKRLRLLAILRITATVGLGSGCHAMRQRGVFSHPPPLTVEPSSGAAPEPRISAIAAQAVKVLEVDPVSDTDEVAVAPANEIITKQSSPDLT